MRHTVLAWSLKKFVCYLGSLRDVSVLDNIQIRLIIAREARGLSYPGIDYARDGASENLPEKI